MFPESLELREKRLDARAVFATAKSAST